MYKVIIKTIYNTINLEVEDLSSPEIQELLEQSYILEVKIENLGKKKVRKKWKKDGATNVAIHIH